MYSWQLLVQLEPQDPFVYPRIGKVRTVRIELVHCGFNIDTVLNTDPLIVAAHSKEHNMTMFLLRYADMFDLQLIQ